MAIDTRNKRSSAILVGLPFRAMLPAPDGAIAQGDRQATAFMYSGILAGTSAVVPTVADLEFISLRTPFDFTPARDTNDFASSRTPNDFTARA